MKYFARQESHRPVSRNAGVLRSRTGSIRAPAPEHGQHTELLLTELLGYGWDEVSGLRERGVI